jgi:hypothetical protein
MFQKASPWAGTFGAVRHPITQPVQIINRTPESCHVPNPDDSQLGILVSVISVWTISTHSLSFASLAMLG